VAFRAPRQRFDRADFQPVRHLASAKYLLASRRGHQSTTNGGWTALLTATNNRHYQFGKYLVEHSQRQYRERSELHATLSREVRNIEGADFRYRSRIDTLEYIKSLDHSANADAKVSSNTETRTIFTSSGSSSLEQRLVRAAVR
jgi:hypothetical protein